MRVALNTILVIDLLVQVAFPIPVGPERRQSPFTAFDYPECNRVGFSAREQTLDNANGLPIQPRQFVVDHTQVHHGQYGGEMWELLTGASPSGIRHQRGFFDPQEKFNINTYQQTCIIPPGYYQHGQDPTVYHHHRQDPLPVMQQHNQYPKINVEAFQQQVAEPCGGSSGPLMYWKDALHPQPDWLEGKGLHYSQADGRVQHQESIPTEQPTKQTATSTRKPRKKSEKEINFIKNIKDQFDRRWGPVTTSLTKKWKIEKYFWVDKAERNKERDRRYHKARNDVMSEMAQRLKRQVGEIRSLIGDKTVLSTAEEKEAARMKRRLAAAQQMQQQQQLQEGTSSQCHPKQHWMEGPEGKGDCSAILYHEQDPLRNLSTAFDRDLPHQHVDSVERRVEQPLSMDQHQLQEEVDNAHHQVNVFVPETSFSSHYTPCYADQPIYSPIHFPQVDSYQSVPHWSPPPYYYSADSPSFPGL